LSEGNQTIDGSKTFTALTQFSNNFQVRGGYGIRFYSATDSHYFRIVPGSNPATDKDYSLPDVTSGAYFVMTEGGQTLNGLKTFGTGVKLPTVGVLLPLWIISKSIQDLMIT